MSFKPSNCVSCLIPRPERMLVPPLFTVHAPVGPTKRTLGFSGSLQ